eukprot:2781697-Rhodomonas_salina.2
MLWQAVAVAGLASRGSFKLADSVPKLFQVQPERPPRSASIRSKNAYRIVMKRRYKWKHTEVPG